MYTNYETVIKDVDTYVNGNSEGIYSIGDEVIVPASGETAEDISRASVVRKPGIILGGDINIIYPNEKIDSEFLALTISNGQQKAEMVKRAQGASIVHLHNNDLKQIKLIFPRKNEQQKISLSISNIEETIVHHQRKLFYREVGLNESYLEKTNGRS